MGFPFSNYTENFDGIFVFDPWDLVVVSFDTTQNSRHSVAASTAKTYFILDNFYTEKNHDGIVAVKSRN